MKKPLIILLAIMFLSGCGRELQDLQTIENNPIGDINSEIGNSENPESPEKPEKPSSDVSLNETENLEPIHGITTNSSPTTNDELYSFIIQCWKNEDFLEIYPYTDANIRQLMDEESFIKMFADISKTGGILLSDTVTINPYEQGQAYSAELDFERITVNLTLILNHAQISGFTRSIHFKNEFEIKYDGYTERYFVLENGEYRLNAVYTYVNDGNSHPAMLLIAGSGPSDYNNTIGLLSPFESIAVGMAKEGVSTLRMDKRTFNYSENFKVTDTIQEEYLLDCKIALDYLTRQPQTSSLGIIGLSLGGQIATEIAKQRDDISSLILWNSSARNLADICYDQYKLADPENAELYRSYFDVAKSLTENDATGKYYYGASDYYWAEYNKLNVIQNIITSGTPTLIVNSNADMQLFEEDINLWKESFANFDKVKIYIDDKMSHIGFEIDMKNQSSLYKPNTMPKRLIDMFSSSSRER